MFRMSRLAASGILLVASVPAYSQLAISAKSGMVHYAEGDVRLADKPVTPKKGEFPQLQEGQTLETGAGRAEVLLTPGVFLRVAEQSSIRLNSGRLSDTRLELLSGSILVEVGEIEKDNSIQINAAGSSLDFRKKGLFRIDASPASVHVYDGEVVAVRDSQTLTVKEGRQTLLAGVLANEKFETDETDAFHRWAGRRASYLAAANVSAAKSVLDSGSNWSRGGWYFNNSFGLYTYLPGSRNYFSPFGYSYYSPNHVGSIFYSGFGGYGSGWNGGAGFGALDASSGGGARSAYGGGNSGMRSSGGYSAGGYSGGSGPVAAAPAAPAAAPRGASGGGSRESRGGR